MPSLFVFMPLKLIAALSKQYSAVKKAGKPTLGGFTLHYIFESWWKKNKKNPVSPLTSVAHMHLSPVAFNLGAHRHALCGR